MKLSLTSCLSVGFCLLWGCGPRLLQNLDEASGELELEIGPLDLGFFSGLNLSARLNPAHLEPPEKTRVIATFKRTEFLHVRIFADGRRFSYPRLSFHENAVWIPLSDLLSIGGAQKVSIRFDEHDKAHELRQEDLRLLHRFAALLGYHYERFRIEGGTKPPEPAKG